ncbi:hypothetical protein NX801_21985 [Streptomyces sp. LP05-1]|uniref:Integral membrane protein n=1 Tax=Streptomyces pyxinae TaxID=2970734 RepID=A0ABT2CLH6_9ACTN|nr:mannosyltransferase family protein [Streptomyces sp. LP05-1]MCS0638273.1 hypothetical protein [Streptomyces sp. LP05-1]
MPTPTLDPAAAPPGTVTADADPPSGAGTVPEDAAPPVPSGRWERGRWEARTRAVLPAAAVYAVAAVLHLVVLALMNRSAGATVYDRLLAWDAQHFVSIATEGYPDHFTHGPEGELTGNTLAFFPLFPLAVRAVHGLTGLGTETAAIVTAHLAFAAALFAVHNLLARLHGRRTALVAIVLLALAQPMALVYFMAYSESLFLALAAAALLAAHRRAWLTAGAFAALAGLTRPVAAAVALAVAVAAAHQMFRARRPAFRPMAAVPLACAGTPAYLLWVGDRLHRPDAWFLIQAAGWDTHWDSGAGFAEFLGYAFTRAEGWVAVSTAVLVLASLGCTAAAWGTPTWPPLLVYGTAVVLVAVGQSNYYHCKLRMLLPAVVFLIPLARALARARTRTLVTTLACGSLFGCWYGAYMLTTWPYAI